jgi:hypothetical protein
MQIDEPAFSRLAMALAVWEGAREISGLFDFMIQKNAPSRASSFS